MKLDTEETRPITVRTVFVWGGLFGGLLTAGWALASDRANVIADVRALQKRADATDIRMLTTEQNASAMQQKLDRALLILERLDKKAGQP